MMGTSFNPLPYSASFFGQQMAMQGNFPTPLIGQLVGDVKTVEFEFVRNSSPVMEKYNAACFLVNRIQLEARQAAVDHLKHRLGGDQERLCVIKCGSRDLSPGEDGCCFSLNEVYVRLGSALKLFRKNATFLGSDDHLIALQLCIAEVNKQKDGKFDVLSSDVLYHHNSMMNASLTSNPPAPNEDNTYINNLYLEYLRNTNTMDASEAYHLVRKYLDDLTQRKGVIGKLSFVIFELPEEPLQKAMLELLLSKKRVYTISTETPLDDSLTAEEGSLERESKIQFQIEETSLEDALNHAGSPCKCPKPESITQLYVERAIMSYFRIIVNSRDEIALATALSSMTQVFSHQAFTALRNKAKAANLSMYQMAVSLITRMKLGGKGYALSPDSPLMPFLPEIFSFTELLGKIQSIVEEDLNTKSAIDRIMKIVKGHITKTYHPKLHKKIIESAAARLGAIADAVVDVSLLPFWNHDNEVENGSSVVGQHTIDTMRHVVNIHNAVSSFGYKTTVLTDCFASQTTPVRLPSLISQFRSPDIDEVNPDDPKPLIQRLKSRMLKERPKGGNSQSVLLGITETFCTTETTPLKATGGRTEMESKSEKIMQVTGGHENTQSAKKGPHRMIKRALVITDDDRSAKAKKIKAVRKPQKARGKPQVKGQQSMTRFLKV